MIDVHYIRHHVEDNPWLQSIVWDAGLNPFLLDDVDDETIVRAISASRAERPATVPQPHVAESRNP